MSESASAIIPRESYLSKLRAAGGRDVIKILTGIRGCGKTALMSAFMDELRAGGVPEDRMLYLDLDRRYPRIRSCGDLLDMVSDKLNRIPGSHIFLDEVQAVPGWEAVVSTLFSMKADICIACSGSRTLPPELSGRCLRSMSVR